LRHTQQAPGEEVLVPDPVMVTVALEGVLNAAPPVGLASAIANVLLPEKGVALLMVTEIVLEDASPLAHCNVPLVAV